MQSQLATTAALSADQVFWLCLIVTGFGAALVWAIVWFGRRIFENSEAKLWEFDRIIEIWKARGSPSLSRYFVDVLTESLQRRNEFWTIYGQVVVAVLIIVILTVLLLTKTISGEAGLPLLSAVSGFAIAKGVNSNRSSSPPSDGDGG